jgi:threonine dehydrogenase-like Zn-dependent dehydrogenase
MSVPADTDDAARDPVTIDVVYCGRCGATLHIFTSG